MAVPHYRGSMLQAHETTINSMQKREWKWYKATYYKFSRCCG